MLAPTDFIVSAQKYVVSSIPKDLLRWAQTDTVAGTHGGDSDPTAITLPVGTDNIVSKLKPLSYNAKASNSPSTM